MSKKRLVALVISLFIMCLSQVAFAIDYTGKYVPWLQGNWYDLKGNVVLSFSGNYVNDCPIIGIYNPAGGGGDVGFVLRINENDVYRDLRLSCTGISPDPTKYHQYIRFNGTTLRRTPAAQFHESVGGLGLGMSADDVIAKYGKPDNYSTDQGRRLQWVYSRLGLAISWQNDIVSQIIIYRNGDRRFDSTGFNCNNSLGEYAEAYGMKSVPRVGYGPRGIGYSEYLWFEQYPNSVELSLFWN